MINKNWIQCKSIKDFIKFKPRKKRKWIPENITWDYGIKYILYSHQTDRHWEKTFSKMTNKDKLKEYIEKRNIFFSKQEHDKIQLKWKQNLKSTKK